MIQAIHQMEPPSPDIEKNEFDQTEKAPHLRLENFGLKRGDRWLIRNLNFEIPRGKFVAIVGPSGVGKTSFLSALAGMIPSSEGSIHYRCLQNCAHCPYDFQKKIGIIFQNLMLTPNNSVLSNVLCGRLGRYPWWKTAFRFPSKDRQEASHILCDLGLGRCLRRWVAEVSGGEQQRTAIARALFQQPEIFLADEPVANLDVYLTGRVLGMLRQEASVNHRTVLCVLHNPEHVERFADVVLSFDSMDPEGWRIRDVR
ncbi:MAG TPA: ATP-binding cassette domain-containing protein [Opitutales bacterium]|nr:ATP-binding cassette domain-containing protein [Opitutales bacterium]